MERDQLQSRQPSAWPTPYESNDIPLPAVSFTYKPQCCSSYNIDTALRSSDCI